MHSATPAIRVIGARLYFLPVKTRVPLKFGSETLTEVTCARVALRVRDQNGREAEGWGETPLSVQWAWPGALAYEKRHEAMRSFCRALVRQWSSFDVWGHPLQIGHAFLRDVLPTLASAQPIGLPQLASLVCCSPFDIAMYDAFGNLMGRPVYELLTREFLADDLSNFLEPAEDSRVSFAGRFVSDFLSPRQNKLPVWHLVGGLDPLSREDLKGDEPDDGYPILLRDWIARDSLKCLKIKLRGTDARWDYQRLCDVGRIAIETGVRALSADFNCTVNEAEYVNQIIDRLAREHAQIDRLLLYVEQPFPYELNERSIDVRSVSARKPLFLDESAHDWQHIRLGRSLGWSGVALKTCKTQTGALLSLCWAKAHGMPVMVQDLTNPMLAQIPHVLLAAHAGTIMGVESNAPQFYPRASEPEARIHPGAYHRVSGELDLASLVGPGFGYGAAITAREFAIATEKDDLAADCADGRG